MYRFEIKWGLSISIIIIATYMYALFIYLDCQNWQDLSYSNIDVQAFNPDAFKPAVTPSTSTTTVAPTSSTTKKSGGFFSGIKKIFGGGKKEEETSSTTAATPTTKSTTTARSRVPTTTTRSSVTLPNATTTVQPRVAGPSVSTTTPRPHIIQSSSPQPSTTKRTRTTTTTVGLVDEWPTLPPVGSDSHRGRPVTNRPPLRPTTPRTGGSVSTVKSPLSDKYVC